jgi:hypothetical protein
MYRLAHFLFLILIARFATLEGMKIKSVTPTHHQMIMVSSAHCRPSGDHDTCSSRKGNPHA